MWKVGSPLKVSTSVVYSEDFAAARWIWTIVDPLYCLNLKQDLEQLNFWQKRPEVGGGWLPPSHSVPLAVFADVCGGWWKGLCSLQHQLRPHPWTCFCLILLTLNPGSCNMIKENLWLPNAAVYFLFDAQILLWAIRLPANIACNLYSVHSIAFKLVIIRQGFRIPQKGKNLAT